MTCLTILNSDNFLLQCIAEEQQKDSNIKVKKPFWLFNRKSLQVICFATPDIFLFYHHDNGTAPLFIILGSLLIVIFASKLKTFFTQFICNLLDIEHGSKVKFIP